MSGTTPDRELADLREAIARCDRGILDQLRKRMELSARAGELKAEQGVPVVAREVEESVLGRARSASRTCGVSESVLEEIFRSVIRASVERQHRIGVEHRRSATSGAVLVLGAAGGMGRWFCSFAELLGHPVGRVDPVGGEACSATLDEVDDLDCYDAIVVAAPLAKMPQVVAELVERKPTALVYELASIKTPLSRAHGRARELGVRLRSIHPMFGPGKAPYDPLTFVVCGGAAERAELEELFTHPYARWIEVPFEQHDPLMGWLLGLGHLTGMLFATALSRSGLDPEVLHACASTTFLRQAATARSILDEDPALYLDIQHLNPARDGVYATLAAVLDEYRGATGVGDLGEFRRLTEAGAAAVRSRPSS
ncbi:MAG: prephenate dehydrogenase/arogenate dehydrogenase family protein [Planctomycetes bacterium]|nr:prephenate dehydrogenase/arogenate dehydrogenase family protein [Planctomycetota bacterium]